MNEHYYCQGSCKGVSPKPGVCETNGCEKENHPLVSCQCHEPEHQSKEN